MTRDIRKINQHRRRTLPAVTVLIMLLGFGVTSVTSAFADTALCNGDNYGTCTSAGYTDHGYSAHAGTSYWGADTGHNCTNYVAYVEQAVNGAPPPSYQLGNADTWYQNATAHGVATNNTPASGAVAWWGDASWNGNAGHVAYVESFNADGSITVSEDAYPNGPFDWRIITPGSSSWPGGFIHFKDLASGGSPATNYLLARVGSTIYAKQNLTDTWSTLTSGTATDVQAAGTRIAFLDNTGTLWAKDTIGGMWYQEIGSVSQYVVTPDYLIARVGNTVYAKAGLTDTWSTLTTDATDVEAAGTRIAILDESGSLWAKDTIGGTWFDETSGVSQYVVTPSYLIVREGTTLVGKQGLGDMWTTLSAGSATDIQAADTRIAFVDNTGTLWAKDTLNGTWYQETSSVSQYIDVISVTLI